MVHSLYLPDNKSCHSKVFSSLFKNSGFSVEQFIILLVSFSAFKLLRYFAVLHTLMWRLVTDGVVWFVGLSVCRNREPWTDRDAVWDVELGGPKEACIASGCTLALPGEYDWLFICVGNAALCQIALTTCHNYYLIMPSKAKNKKLEQILWWRSRCLLLKQKDLRIGDRNRILRPKVCAGNLEKLSSADSASCFPGVLVVRWAR